MKDLNINISANAELIADKSTLAVNVGSGSLEVFATPMMVALMENAMDNGVKLHLCEEVESINKFDNYFVVKTNKNTYETKYVINCAGVYSDKVLHY